MFNPQLEEMQWRTTYKGTVTNTDSYSGITWVITPMIDLKKGDLFKLEEKDEEKVLHEDGRDTFVAESNGYINELGIPQIDIG